MQMQFAIVAASAFDPGKGETVNWRAL